VCYAYLDDVLAAHTTSDCDPPKTFSQSRWFKRGWTLQELLAPTSVLFYGEEWTDTSLRDWSAVSLGSKTTLRRAISDITGIPKDILMQSKAVDSASVAQRMSWAATRQTSRPEDEAYCLMGLFDVNMPML